MAGANAARSGDNLSPFGWKWKQEWLLPRTFSTNNYELVKKSAVEKHPKMVTAEIPGAGGLWPATSSTTAATVPAAWSWQVVGKML